MMKKKEKVKTIIGHGKTVPSLTISFYFGELYQYCKFIPKVLPSAFNENLDIE
jgi:hypothetical protein